MFRNTLSLIGALLALVGSIGLFQYGQSIVGVFEVLAIQITPGEQPEVLPALQDWPVITWALSLLTIGWSFTCFFAPTKVARKWLSATAGAVNIAGSIPVCLSILQTLRSFRVIATSAVAPTPEAIQNLIYSSKVLLSIGFASFCLAAVLLIAAGFQSDSSFTKTSWVIRAATLFLFITSLVVTYSFAAHGNSLKSVWGIQATKPQILASHLTGSQQAALTAFLCIGLLGAAKIVSLYFAARDHVGTDQE